MREAWAILSWSVVSSVLLGCSEGSAVAVDGGLDASIEVPDDAAEDAGEEDAGRGPPYPVVLAHGFFGFEDFAGAGFVDYFWRVREDLAAHGETEVTTPAVDPFNSSEARAAQLAAHVEEVLRTTGAARVNVVGHSQGGLDARVLAHEHPEWVASVTTIATPHGGSRVSDVTLGLVADDRAQDLADALARAIAAPLYDADGEETSVFEALRQFSAEGVAALDRDHPDADGVAYFSIGGRSEYHPGGDDCAAEGAPAFVVRWDEQLDAIDPLLALSEDILSEPPMNLPNDGLVTARASRHGRWLGCIPADHFDEIGHLLGDRPGLSNDFDHLAFYRELVAWLRSEGY